jgi:hypothetical protein
MARGVGSGVVFLILMGTQAYGQPVISAQAGLVHHTEGRVFLNEKLLPRQFGRFPQIRESEVFNTGRGRAEILLSPGVFLRLGQDTSIRMLSGRITDAKVELLSGEVVLETVELNGIESVTVALGEYSVSTSKRGLYRLEANPAGLRVLKGKALVVSGNRRVEVQKGREVMLGGSLTALRFDSGQTDALDRWSDRRSRMLAWVDGTALLRTARLPVYGDYMAADAAISGSGSGRRTRQSARTYGGGLAP